MKGKTESTVDEEYPRLRFFEFNNWCSQKKIYVYDFIYFKLKQALIVCL